MDIRAYGGTYGSKSQCYTNSENQWYGTYQSLVALHKFPCVSGPVLDYFG